MLESPSAGRAFFSEVAKVLAVFTAFYLLQTQILEIQRDIHGRTSGLAHAQAATSSELGQTREFVQLALEDSTLGLRQTRDELETSVRELEAERQNLLAMIEQLSRDMGGRLQSQISEGTEEIRTLRHVIEDNVSRIERLSNSVQRDSLRMKRSMIFPTIQLRGNGTVGSGVLIYSEPQPDAASGTVYTTFALTACHVVQEVVGRELEAGQEVGQLRVIADGELAEMESLVARLVLFDFDRDTALLRIDSTRRFDYLAHLMPRKELSSLDVFSPAYAVGCPLGNYPMPTLGEVSSRQKRVGRQVFWMLNAPTFFGNSGGGVFLAPDYELIGVSSMIYTYGKKNPTVVPHMGLFVPLEAIYDWLVDEGYEFVLQRRPVPATLRESLVFSRDPLRNDPAPIGTAPLEVRVETSSERAPEMEGAPGAGG